MNPTITLWQYDWIQQGRSATTLRYMTREVERYLKWLDAPLESATVADCLSYLAERAQIGKHPAFSAWRSLRSVYGFTSVLDGSPSPMEKIKCPRVDEPSVRSITLAEYKQMLLVCGGDNRDKAIIALLFCTGLRRTELANLTMDAVNLEQKVLIVRRSKTGKPRVVPMSTEATVYLLKYLRLRRSSTDALWIGKKGVLTTSGIRLVIARRAKQAGVKVSAHQFRRGFAVNWLSDGGSQVSLMSICGWASTAMPARYTRHAAERVAESEYRRLFP